MINGDLCHGLLIDRTKPELEFGSNTDLQTWKRQLKEKFLERLGLIWLLKMLASLSLKLSKSKKNEHDDIFPVGGVKEGFETVKSICEICGGKDRYKLAITPKNHYWCADIVWDNILASTKEMNWINKSFSQEK